jgi:hypothetical protein
MSDRPTPETDANYWREAFGGEFVTAAFARKLERERDEAREKIVKLRVKLWKLKENIK